MEKIEKLSSSSNMTMALLRQHHLCLNVAPYTALLARIASARMLV